LRLSGRETNKIIISNQQSSTEYNLMTIQLDLIKQSQLIGKLVLDRQTMEEIGKVDRVWLNPHTHRIIGFTSKSGLLGMKKRSFAW